LPDVPRQSHQAQIVGLGPYYLDAKEQEEAFNGEARAQKIRPERAEARGL